MRIGIVGYDTIQAKALACTLIGEGHAVLHHPSTGHLSTGDLLHLVVAERIDLVILDVDLYPFGETLDVCSALQAETDALLLMVGTLDSSAEAVCLLEAGADHCLARPIDFADLLARAHALLRRRARSISRNGGTNGHDSAGNRAVGLGAEGTGSANSARLTPREQDVLMLAGDGLPSRQIAAALAISAKTVEYHVSHILAKLQVHSRTAAVRKALDDGILCPSDERAATQLVVMPQEVQTPESPRVFPRKKTRVFPRKKPACFKFGRKSVDTLEGRPDCWQGGEITRRCKVSSGF
ncbi:MAG: response regulator transcription factor [Chloroflexi bacterium]|nr:response regulator transcription factor [Chloroflexota bacterium]